MRNLRLAFRTLGRTPFVTTVAALSLGLGIGANSAIYSIFYRMVRQELPVAGADRLVNFSAPGPKDGSMSCGQAGPLRRRLQLPDVSRSPEGKADCVHRHRRSSRHQRERQLSSGARSRAADSSSRAATFRPCKSGPRLVDCSRHSTTTRAPRRPSCSRTGSGRRTSAPTRR